MLIDKICQVYSRFTESVVHVLLGHTLYYKLTYKWIWVWKHCNTNGVLLWMIKNNMINNHHKWSICPKKTLLSPDVSIQAQKMFWLDNEIFIESNLAKNIWWKEMRIGNSKENLEIGIRMEKSCSS